LIRLARLRQAWNRFFYEPASPLPVAVYRAMYGFLVLVNVLLLLPDAADWFSELGVVPLSIEHKLEPMSRLDLMALLPGTPEAARIYLLVLAAAAACLMLGFYTRIAAVVTYLGLTSLHHRNVFILHGGDTLLRVMGFYLVFADAGARLSLDRWFSGEKRPPPNVAPWAQRLMQLQLCALYLFTSLSKMSGNLWADGTAVYYVLNLDEFRRFPVPLVADYLPLVKLATWGTLVVEFSLATLIWVYEWRYKVLLAGLLLHLGIEWSMNVPLFQWAAIAGYVLFIPAEDIEATLDRLKAWLRPGRARRAVEAA